MSTRATKPNATPPAEVELTSELVAALLAEQHPDLANLPLQLIGEGWDNAMFRLGDSLAVRLPRRRAAAQLICHEQAWLPRLAPRLTVPVPAPCRVGLASLGYPWHWSIVPWIAGKPGHLSEPATSEGAVLGAFLRSLHIPAPLDAPRNPVRGLPLQQRATSMEERLDRLASKTNLIRPAIRRIWQTGVTAPFDAPSTWLHGDLHPQNVLVEQGVISGIIDWGDVTSGDPATDLASIWMLFADPQAYQLALSAYGEVSAPTLDRAKAWAVFFAVMFLDTGLTDHPTNAALGARILQRF